ncbi:MAG: DUF885 family protein [Clostridiales bacterium]|nr:DUF885 family protein [Clostridiales bacterium]
MKKTLCLLLAFLMAFSLAACKRTPKEDDQPTEAPTQAPTASPEATEQPTEVPTEIPTEVPTEVPTEAPTTPPVEEDTEADAAFRELDLQIFRDMVVSSSSTYNQYIVSDPAKFGIDPADVNPGWGEYSYESNRESMEYYRGILEELENIDYDRLNTMNRRAYDFLKNKLEYELKYEDYYYYQEPLEPMNGYHTMLPLSMICFTIRQKEDVDAYMFLIEDLERLLGQIGQFEVEKAEHGLFMCETALDQVVESCRNMAAMGEDSMLVTYFETVLEKAKELGFTDKECEKLRKQNKETVLKHVLPAYTALADTLEAHREDCTEFTGAVGRSQEAKDYFVLSALDEGATLGTMSEAVKLLESMGQGTYEEMFRAAYSSSDVLSRYGEPISFGTVEDNVAWLEDFIKVYYPALPDYTLEYITIPEDIAEDFSPAAYLNPAFDDYYDNVMLINPTSEGAKELLTVAHETIPGHMYQFLFTRDLPGLSLTQQVMEPNGYAEAWTVFTEHFVATHCDDIGKDFCTMMNCESAFCNVYMPAYISIKVNYNGWNKDRVAAYLSGYGLDGAADIFYEYAVTMPTYAMSYAIGYSYLYDIYNNANVKTPEEHIAFFEKYLSFGPDYMDVMRRSMME